MKKYKRILIILISVLIMIQSIIFNTQVVYAADHVSGDNVVYREVAANVSLTWGFIPNVGAYKYYVDDASGIPTGGNYYFWKYGDNDKFAAVERSKIYAYVLNNGVGLTVSNERLSELVTAYYSQFTNVEAGYLYDGNGNKLGICLNDITGCVYEAYPQNTNIDIPATETNNIYNFYQYYINTVSPELPDYINIVTKKTSEALNLVNVSNAYLPSYRSALGSIGDSLTLYFYFVTGTGKNFQNTLASGTNYRGFKYLDISKSTLYCSDSTWTNFCNSYGLKNNGDTVKFEDVTINGSGDLNVYAYDNENQQLLNTCDFYTCKTDGTYTNSSRYIESANASWFHLVSNTFYPVMKNGDTLCVYKNSGIFTQIVNNTYAPQTFTSNQYNNFNTNNTQNMNTNTSVINNSTDTNNSIYNDASQSFNEYYSSEDNYNIDNSVVMNNTTQIIYNYYGNGSDPDPNPNPNPNPDDDDDPIWSALLKAIADFFKKLGELIATVLTGIVTILTSILEAIATIVTDFTGITDFLGQIFAWLPSEIITLMTLGLTTALFAAFLTWFKK